MVLLFLYHRLHGMAKRQLESLRHLDYDALEQLTAEREGVTRELCQAIDDLDAENKPGSLSEPVRRKIRELTAQTLAVDTQIKRILLEELREKTLELNERPLQND